jgi:hypothetical protein
MSNHAVAAALMRHGLTRTAHAGKRNAARERAAQVAAALGVDSVPCYVAERRTAGWTWQAIAAECGQPQSWLRRQAALPTGPSGVDELLATSAAPDQHSGQRSQQRSGRSRDPLEYRQAGHPEQVQRVVA